MLFSKELVTRTHWVRWNDWATREFRCHPDGTLTEWDPADPTNTWGGRWAINSMGDIFMLQVGPWHVDIYCHPHASQYADTTFSAHESKEGDTYWHKPFNVKRVRLVHTKDNPPFTPVPPPFPGRDHLPIFGPPRFITAVAALLDELEQKLPHRYREVLEYLPEARFDESLVLARAHAGGSFAIDRGDRYFKYTFFHEVGHNVAGHTTPPGSDLSTEVMESQATAYERMVITELGLEPR